MTQVSPEKHAKGLRYFGIRIWDFGFRNQESSALSAPRRSHPILPLRRRDCFRFLRSAFGLARQKLFAIPGWTRRVWEQTRISPLANGLRKHEPYPAQHHDRLADQKTKNPFHQISLQLLQIRHEHDPGHQPPTLSGAIS